MRFLWKTNSSVLLFLVSIAVVGVTLTDNLPCGSRPLFPKTSGYRIVGGELAAPGQLPWQVFLTHKFSKKKGAAAIICGGVVIHEKWVLTAAHCTEPEHHPLTVISGTTNATNFEDRPLDTQMQVFNVSQVIRNDYDFQTQRHDIALLEVEPSIRFDNFTQPICLAHPNNDFRKRVCSASGWGMTVDESFFTSGPTQYLKVVNLTIIANPLCNRYLEAAQYDYDYYEGDSQIMLQVYDEQICAMYEAGGRDTCFGDSGGPLACLMESGQYVLAALSSWGLDCGEKNSPGVYTRISNYFSWIQNVSGVKFE